MNEFMRSDVGRTDGGIVMKYAFPGLQKLARKGARKRAKAGKKITGCLIREAAIIDRLSRSTKGGMVVSKSSVTESVIRKGDDPVLTASVKVMKNGYTVRLDYDNPDSYHEDTYIAISIEDALRIVSRAFLGATASPYY